MADSMTMDVSNLTAEQSERMMVAVHEAGHVLGCRIVGTPVVKATIEPTKKNDGHVLHTKMVTWEDSALISYMGRAAELEFGYKDDDWGSYLDYEHSEKELREDMRFQKSKAWSARSGIWGRLNGRKTTVYAAWDINPRTRWENGKPVDMVRDWKKSVRVTKKEIQPTIDRLRRKARRLARKHHNYIERVANLLLEKGTLTDEEIPQL